MIPPEPPLIDTNINFPVFAEVYVSKYGIATYKDVAPSTSDLNICISPDCPAVAVITPRDLYTNLNGTLCLKSSSYFEKPPIY